MTENGAPWTAGVKRAPEGTFREDPDAWAAALGVSREALQVYLGAEIIDLHIDSFIWTRVFGYDLCRRHQPRVLPGWLWGQVDLPRIVQAQIGGAAWVITTNPWRSGPGRLRAFCSNLDRLRRILTGSGRATVVRTMADYTEARAAGQHAAWLAIQGGNALTAAADLTELLAEGWLSRVTLVHLTNSELGATSSPLRGAQRRLGSAAGTVIEQLNAARVFVDLAHLHEQGFQQALEVHSRHVPPLVTHTGVSGAHRHWRNLEDRQLRAIAERGGTIGVMYHSPFLGDSGMSGKAATVLRHLQHIVDTIGEDHASLGSDWDGAITTPRDMPTCLELPRLVELMLRSKWSLERIGKVLGGNYLRCFAALRPGAP